MLSDQPGDVPQGLKPEILCACLASAAESENLSKNYANRLSRVCEKLIQVMVSAEAGQSS